MNTEIDVPFSKKINLFKIRAEIKAAMGEDVGVTHIEASSNRAESAFIIHASREFTKTEIEGFLKNHAYTVPPTPVKPKGRKEQYAGLTTDRDRIEFLAKEKGLK